MLQKPGIMRAMKTERMLGLDFGSKTVGVAISDPFLLTAQPMETIKRERETKLRRTLARIDEIIRTEQIGRVVVGYPRHLSGEEGTRCQKAREFAERIERRTDVPVVLWDERLSTVEAEGVLKEAGIRGADMKQSVDKIAAALILQNYLDSIRNSEG